MLTTNLHVKVTLTMQYPHRDSCHPGQCKWGIPYSQALRIHGICSRMEEYLWRTQELKGFLIYWGYSRDEVHVQQKIDRTTGLNRDVLLQLKKTKTPLEWVPLIVTYHQCLPALKGILEKHSSILNVSERFRQAVRNPSLVAYHRPTNLRSLLVWAMSQVTRPIMRPHP